MTIVVFLQPLSPPMEGRPSLVVDILHALSSIAARMRLWVDADAAPRDVKEIVQNAARRLEIETFFVANRRLALPPANRFVTAICVDGGPDVADSYIAERAEPGDVAVTADIPL